MAGQPIVVGFDDTPSSRDALAWALGEARGRRADVLLVHAVREFPILAGHGDYVAFPREIATGAGEAVLQVGTSLATELAPDVSVSTRVLEDAPAAGLLATLDGAQMAVLGSRGRGGLAELVIGSTSLKVASHAPCPVVVLRSQPESLPPGPEAGRVVAGVDAEGEGSSEVLAFAFEEAAWRDVGLTVIYAWHEDFYDLPGKGGSVPRGIQLEEFQAAKRQELSTSLVGWQEKYPDVDVRRDVVPQTAASVLTAASAGAELVVVGSRRRGGPRSIALGHVGHALLHHAHCPVAVIGHR
jgi:nucleotide-binding universal stress UspA family protein